MKNVIVIAPHPDDETLGAGGTILKHKDNGDSVHWVVLSSAFAREKGAGRRQKEIRSVAKEYGFDGVHDPAFPSKQLDSVSRDKLVEKISSIIASVRPDTIYLPFYGDVHSDHKVSFDAAFSAAKTFRHTYIRKILMMEIPSETDFAIQGQFTFAPNYFVDISKYLERKISIMKLYSGQLGEHPFPRSTESIRSLAVVRGAMCGAKYAESFMLLKEIS